MSNSSSSDDFYKSYPITCDLSYNPFLEIFKYIIQAGYLFIGACLIIYMLYIMLFKYRPIYWSKSYFRIFIFDLITTLIRILSDMFFGRVILNIPPLCPILSPFFSDYSFILKSHKVIENYVAASKSVCQVILTLNRMTCTMLPVTHNYYWDKYIVLAMLLNFALPFGAIWSLIHSRVYGKSTFGGFYTSYKRAISWASLSRLQSICVTISIVLTLIFSTLTFWSLKNLSERAKNVEKMLCFVTFWLTGVFVFISSIWYFWALCSNCSWDNPWIFQWQLVSYDLMMLGTPIVMIIINRQLRN
ncbi:unnamed protein product [Caenorhabditis angaria]|uniref:Serpentine receptor class gamma n=1 Tax=Caenorhabditis angaria TaxID=860376 RepID=A0A9P1IG74_9PELO|nr:unnamed protein product [Caenorhabditis angaria]